MGKTVKVPDPVYDSIVRQAERQDIANGVVVKQWQEKADKFDEMEVRR